MLALRRRHGANWRPNAQAQVLNLHDWTLRYRQNLKPALPLDFGRHAFLVDLYKSDAQRLVVYKASQMGASEYAVSYALHAADQRRATVLYLFPNDGAVSDFSMARIGPAIEASEYLASKVVEARGGGASQGEARKRGADRVTLKRVGDRFIYLRGATVSPEGMAPQLKSVDADVLVLDEVDEMDPRAPSIAVKRLGHSVLAEERWISTPTYPGRGIHAKWLESDQREWHVRCGRCGEWQQLRMEQVVTEWDQLGRPRTWHGQGDGRAWAACRKCGAEVDRLGQGQWVALYPGRDVVGYHLTKLFSPLVQLVDLVKALDTTDETKRREAFNQDLGEPYTPRGGQLTDDVLDDCRRDYAPGIVPGVRPVAGVDVGRVLHVVIRAQSADKPTESRQLFAGETTWADLPELLKRHRVRMTVMDALPETTKAREFQALMPKGSVWLAYYVNQAAGTKRHEPAAWDEQEGVVNLDRTRTLDAMFGRFYEKTATLPANGREIRDYYSHMKASVRVIEERPGGQQVARYVEAGPDHYCLVAGTLIATQEGQVPIESIHPGMRVMTRAGLRRVLAAGQTSPVAAVRRYVFSNGAAIIATPNHPVFVCGRGFVPLDTVNYGDTIMAWQSNHQSALRQSSTRVLRSGVTRIVQIVRAACTSRPGAESAGRASSVCTRSSGKTLTGLFHRGTAYTTGMATRSTTISPISNVSPSRSTNRTTAKRGGKPSRRTMWQMLWTASDHSLKRGTRPLRARRCIEPTPCMRVQLSNRLTPAFSAVSPSSQCAPREIPRTGIVPTPAIRRIAGLRASIMKRVSVRFAALRSRQIDSIGQRPAPSRAVPNSPAWYVGSQPAGNLPVYNLTVEDAHEYFANGVLVHNCHAENYCLVAESAPRRPAGVLVQAAAKGW